MLVPVGRAKQILLVVGVCAGVIGLMALPFPRTSPKALTQSLFERIATTGAFTRLGLILRRARVTWRWGHALLLSLIASRAFLTVSRRHALPVAAAAGPSETTRSSEAPSLCCGTADTRAGWTRHSNPRRERRIGRVAGGDDVGA
jgi:hypothetical protein